VRILDRWHVPVEHKNVCNPEERVKEEMGKNQDRIASRLQTFFT
jgi:hypothetical protein